MPLEFQLFQCKRCLTPETYATLGELEAHRLAQHERPVPAAACAARLTEAATRTIGRTREADKHGD